MNALHTGNDIVGSTARRAAGKVLLALALTTFAGAQIPSYTIYSLGTLPGGFGSASRGVNNASVVAGQSHNGTRQHAFRWKLNLLGFGVITDLGVLPGTLDSDGANISPGGTVVGTSDTTPVRWSGGAVALPGIGDATHGAAFAAKSGTTVGFLTSFIPGWGIVAQRAVKWQTGKATEVHPVDATLSQAFDINASGQIAGWASATAFGPPHAMRWGGGGAGDVHGGFTGKVHSNGFALNNDGTVVGMAFSAASATDAVPFQAKVGVGMALLPLPGGTPRGRALDINKDGSVVGFGDPGTVALLWLPGMPVVDLQTRIPAGTGWTLRSATSINDHGEIAGWGIFAGTTRAFLLRPTTYNPGSIEIEIIDPAAPESEPNPGYPLLTSDDITTDKTKLATGGQTAIGVVADGTTRLLLRITTSDPGTVTVSFPGSGDDDEQPATGIPTQDGWLGAPGAKPGATTVTTATTSIGGKNVAFAVYRAPERLPAEFDGVSTRTIALKVRFDGPDGTDPVTDTVEVRVERPPLLAMHGLWSSFDGAYHDFKYLLEYQINGLIIEGPSYDNAAHFEYNKDQVTNYIHKLRLDRRQQKIAMVQADVVGHSMGGILSRKWAGDDRYRAPANYKEGEINRLITIDSPHCGALLMDAAWELHQFFAALGGPAYVGFELFWLKYKMPLSHGAVQDLGTQSSATAALTGKEIHVPCHAIAGNKTFSGGVEVTVDPGQLSTFLTLLGSYKVAVSANLPTESDLLVSLENQLGGLTDLAASVHNHQHDGAPNAQPVIDDCVNLLRVAPSSPYFADGFPTGCPPQPPLVSSTFAFLSALDLLISLPLTDALIDAGTNAAVSVVNQAAAELIKLKIILNGTVKTLLTPPWTTTIPVPVSLIGDVTLQVIGSRADGSVSTTDRIIHVVTSAVLDLFTATPPVIPLFSLNSPQRVHLEGTYSDAVVRDLTNASTGTTYVSSNTGNVTVDADGWLTAVANGTATVTATNGTKTAPIAVTVALVPESDLAIDAPGFGIVMFTGESIGLGFTAENHGPDAARPVDVFLSGPPAVGLTGTTASAGAWNNNAGPAWHLANLAASGSAALSFNIKALTPGTGTVNATITGAGRDFIADNNTLSIPVRVFADPLFAFGVGGGSVHFITDAGVLYTLESSPDLAPGHWTPVTSVPGDGTEKTLPLAGSAQRVFHRLRLTAP